MYVRMHAYTYIFGCYYHFGGGGGERICVLISMMNYSQLNLRVIEINFVLMGESFREQIITKVVLHRSTYSVP